MSDTSIRKISLAAELAKTAAPPVHPPITVTISTARKLSGLGATTIWRLIKDHKLEVVRVGRRTLVTFRSLEALLTPCSSSEPRGHRGRPRKRKVDMVPSAGGTP